MNKSEFMRELKRELKKRNVNDIPEILSDYEEHFSAGKNAYKTEWEIVEELGPINLIADEYSVINKGGNAKVIYKNTPRPHIGLFIALIFFDVIIGIAAVSVIFALLVSLVAVSVSMVIGGGVYAVFSFFLFGVVSIKFAGFFIALAAMILGILAGLSIKPAIKSTIFLIKQYFNLHKRILGGKV